MWLVDQNHDKDLPTVHLQPSELLVARQPTMLVTILGSCVAVCLHDRKRKVGAMCHGLLPKAKASAIGGDCSRFVDCAIHAMVKELAEKCGSSPADLDAKLFGGARMFSQVIEDGGGHMQRVGVENIETARAVLRDYGMRVSVEDVGAAGGYKIFFESHTGKVVCKSLRPQHVKSVFDKL
ncbi:MAG: chemotaxis protein CheD [Desulfobulbaceae bacterium]|nr:chemotaxis protein CheD [Desulfobulbaceae bacterium]